ncbi:MAG: hypothetical protein AAF004_05900 [Pseudomonadota bacterium]
MNVTEQERPIDDDSEVEDANEEEFATTIVIENNDNVGGVSVEINVQELVADIEQAKDSSAAGVAARRRLEALMEEKRLERLLDEDDDFGISDLDANA